MAEPVNHCPFNVEELLLLLEERVAKAKRAGYMGQEERASVLALVVVHRMRTGASAHAKADEVAAINVLVAVVEELTFGVPK